jgi:lipoprotein Spr
VIIKRFSLFITIALLFVFPTQLLALPAKNSVKKNAASPSKKTVQKESPGAKKITAEKKSRKSVKANKKRSKQVAREHSLAPKDAPPLLKVTPLENGKFLLEPMDSSLNMETAEEALSLIKKPIFDNELNRDRIPEEKRDALLGFPQLLVQVSKQLLGKAYRLGGNGQGSDGIDCSGYMKKIYQAVTLSLPHSSREQAKLGSLVSTDLDFNRLRIGDLLFFKRGRGSQIGHTGMYIGEGQMIHSSSKKGVIITNLDNSDYYNRNFVMAKRLFILDRPDVDEFKEFKQP